MDLLRAAISGSSSRHASSHAMMLEPLGRSCLAMRGQSWILELLMELQQPAEHAVRAC